MKTTIHLKLYAGLQKYASASDDNHPIETGDSVREVLNRLGVPPDKPLLVFINGNRSKATSLLQGEELVKVFPPMRGG